MKSLHPGAVWQFRFRTYGSLFFLFVFAAVFSASRTGTGINAGNVFLAIAGAIVLMIVLGEIYARMSYNRWFYEFTKDNLKLERGIIWKRYSNVPYERVQNVDITRGILARVLGFSTVNIQTAGFSYGGKNNAHAEGYIPAVSPEEAEHIRDFLMKKIHKRSGGL